MARGKYYVRVADDVTVARVRTAEPDMQVTEDLAAGAIIVQGYEIRSGAILYTAEDDPDGVYATDLPRPRLAQELVNFGAFWSDDTRVDVRGGLWLFGPGRGWTHDEAAEEAQRLLSIL